jgi:hypothetical protein
VVIFVLMYCIGSCLDDLCISVRPGWYLQTLCGQLWPTLLVSISKCVPLMDLDNYPLVAINRHHVSHL